MSTNDVPGHRAVNRDVLAMGSWAEHQDGSLILVLSTEADKVVYEIFELSGTEKFGYKHAMPDKKFKSNFSWDPKKVDNDVSNEKWTWHDKTPFPWERVMKEIEKPVPEPVSATAKVSAAKRIIDSLRHRGEKLEGEKLSAETLSHMVDQESFPGAKRIVKSIARALDAFADEMQNG